MKLSVRGLLVLLLLSCPLSAGAAALPRHTLMRYPTLHGDEIVFVAHDNLWKVARTGGMASRLTAEAGHDLMPRYSPDGRWLAFTGEYQGNRDVYVMPADGGEARRLTFTSDVVDDAPLRWGPNNMVLTWTPDSKNIVFLSRRAAWNSWFGLPFAVPVTGGLPVALPLDRGGFMSYSPDGKRIAYNRIFRNFRTWKRYRGGLAQDIDIYDFEKRQLTHVTEWPGTETSPMWYAGTIYFLSDHDVNQRANLWVHDLATHQFRQVTHYTDYDIDFPSLGTGNGAAGIVFQQGGTLHVLDLPSEELHDLDVTVPDDGTRTGVQWVDARKAIRVLDMAGVTDFDLAPSGKRAVFSARGELVTVPAEHGNTRNLTQSSSGDEDHPSWSPDGKTIAYTTDASGQPQVAIRPAEGGPETVLTHFERGYFYQPRWAPGADFLAFSDNDNRVWITAVAGGEPRQVDQDAYGEIHDYSWSPDGRWLAYSKVRDNQQRGIWLYSLKSTKTTLVSEAASNDFAPEFDPEGAHLYFLSTRHENPTFSSSEFNIATLKTMGIYVATLRRGEPSPFAPQSDEGVVEAMPGKREASGSTAGNGAGGNQEPAWKPGAIKPIRIDLDGLMSRAVPMPVTPADIGGFDLRKGKVYYLTQPSRTIAGPLPGETPVLHVYDLDKRKEDTVVEGLSDYVLSADGAKVLYRIKNEADPEALFIVAGTSPVPPDSGKDDENKKTLDLSHMSVRVDPRREWEEMFRSAWQIERDFFYSPKMNGVDWSAVRDSYAKLLALAGARTDLNYVIGEMLGELGNSHTYVGGADGLLEDTRMPTAFLGADFALDADSGRYRLSRIYPGDNTRDAYRSPLTAPGLDVHTGDYLLAIDGVELVAPMNPYSLLVGKQDGTVKLTIAESPSGHRRDLVVEPVKTELSLREKAWIDGNRALVDRLSDGQVAYIYLSDMSALGMEQFVRQFYAQLDKRGLIVDDRWNGGGFIDQIVLERLRRVLVGMATNRQGTGVPVPQQLIRGPKICLINHYSASDGDLFPFFFRKYGLGPLLGTRTWGGVRGIRGEWGLLDGGYITVPENSFYGLDSQWVMENHGVEPDIPVDDSPADWAAGHDVQLEAAVRHVLERLEGAPATLPPPPAPLPAYPPEAGPRAIGAGP